MCRIVSFICVVSMLALGGCAHRDHAFKNQFELVGDHDVIPEPGEHNRELSSTKDTALIYGLDDAFSSRETPSWRTRVIHSLRGERGYASAEGEDWKTSYTHTTRDRIDDTSWQESPVEIYRRTGRWPLKYTLDTGDRLRVIVYSQRTLSRVYTVDDSGHISVPLVGQIKARGATTKQVENRITSYLKKNYLRDPKVSVEVATYRPFFVLGEVRQAGQFPYVVGMTAETAAAIAGGYTARADERKIRVSRVYKGRRYTLLVSKNFPIFPGDTVYVRERLF